MADRVVGLVIGVQHNTQGGKGPDRWVCRGTKGGRGAMTTAPLSLPDLRRRIDRKAQAEKAPRCWGLFGHGATRESLAEAYHQARRHGGAPGLDGQTCGDIAAGGVE